MSIFKTENGKEYNVIKSDKNKNVALLVDVTATIQPYIVAIGLKENYWCEGHYFSDLSKAEMCYDQKVR